MAEKGTHVMDAGAPSEKEMAFVAFPVTPQKGNAVMVSSQPILHDQAAFTAHAAPLTPPYGNAQTAPALQTEPCKRHHCVLRFLVLTLKLVPFHVLNFALGTAAFVVVITGVCLSVGLIPLCCIGIPLFIALLYIVQWLSFVDVALANFITAKADRVPLIYPKRPAIDYNRGLSLSSRLNKLSWRSTGAIIYFLTLKFALGIVSCVVVCLPFLPIAGHIVHTYTSETVNTYTIGWNNHKFNWDTEPVWFTLASVGIFIAGIVLMHLVGMASRVATRVVCCEVHEPVETMEPQCVYASQV